MAQAAGPKTIERIRTRAARWLTRQAWRRWGVAALLLLILWAGIRLRFDSLRYDWYVQADEANMLAVTEHVASVGNLDTSWNVPAIPAPFRALGYHFSGYFLASALALHVAGDPPEPRARLLLLRRMSAAYGALAILATSALGMLLFGAAPAVAAAGLAALATQLYQDGLYVRPETFVTLLFLAAISLLLWDGPPRGVRGFIAAVVFGFLLATKVSFLPLAPVLILAWVPRNGTGLPRSLLRRPTARELRAPASIAAILCAGTALGFALGAPYAVLHPGAYWDGIELLSVQYHRVHWPHSLPGAGLLERLAFGFRFFRATLGLPLLLAALWGGAACVLARNWRAALLFALSLPLFAYFCATPAFFERNVSHLLPLVLLFAAYGAWHAAGLAARWPIRSGVRGWARWRAGAVRGAAFAALLIPVALTETATTAKLRFVVLPGYEERRVTALRQSLEAEFGVRALDPGWIASVDEAKLMIPGGCAPALVRFRWPLDAVSQSVLDWLTTSEGFRDVGRVESAFSDIPTSTLHTYHSATSVFLWRDGHGGRCGGGLERPGQAATRLRER